MVCPQIKVEPAVYHNTQNALYLRHTYRLDNCPAVPDTLDKDIMARYETTLTLVDCEKFGQPLPALERPPFPGELGKRIYENISKLAWSMWQQQSTILINHYGLNLADPRAQEFLFEQMEEFFFGSDEQQMPEDWTPPAG